MEFGFTLSIFALISGLLGITLFSIGSIKNMNTVNLYGIVALFVTAAIAIGIGICIVGGSLQLWETSELEKLTKAKPETVPTCFIFGESKLCGEFIYEDKNFRYISKNGNTLVIENKENN